MPPSDALPTDAELAILRVLWTHGPATVQEVQNHLDDDRGYTTVLKHLQIMLEKGLVSRDESQRAHVYRASVAKDDTQRRLVDDLLDRAFGGSARQLVMRALSTDRVTHEEIDRIRDLLDEVAEDREQGSDDGTNDDGSMQ